MICQCNPLSEIGKFGRLFTQTAKLMVGIPDYDNYVAHRRQTHPDQPILTEIEFFRNRQDHRYGGGPGVIRCC